MNRKRHNLVILVVGVTLLLSLLSIVLALAAPDTAASSLPEEAHRLNGSPVFSNDLIDAADVRVCDTYYFRSILVNVGFDGNRPVADRTVPFAAVYTPASATLNQDQEIARFYSHPPLTDSLHISEDVSGLLWINTSRPDASLNIKMFDYNPGNGAQLLLGEFPFTLLSAGETSIEFNITSPAAPIPAGHRLLFVLEGKKGTPPPTVELRYDSATRASRFTVCRLIPGGAPPATNLYLPIIMSHKAGPTTALYIESVNTGGINPVRVLDLNTNQELLRCTIGNNVTQLCGSFSTPINGAYKITAQTNRCGLLQGTFADAASGGAVTRRIFCN